MGLRVRPGAYKTRFNPLSNNNGIFLLQRVFACSFFFDKVLFSVVISYVRCYGRIVFNASVIKSDVQLMTVEYYVTKSGNVCPMILP